MQRQSKNNIPIINFRTIFEDGLFNGAVRKALSDIKNDCMKGLLLDQYCIDETLHALKNYYEFRKHEVRDYAEENESIFETIDRVTNIIFSYYLQDFVYFLTHPRQVRDFYPDIDKQNILFLINQPLFFFALSWREPKENYNVLNSLCDADGLKNESDKLELVKTLLAKAKLSMSDSEFKEFIENRDHRNHSPFHTLCLSNDDSVARELLVHFKESYGLTTVKNIMSFINKNKDKYHFTPFFSACKNGLNQTIKLCFDYMSQCPDVKDEDFFALINQRTVNGSTPLIEACINGKKETAEIILSTAEKFSDHDTYLNYMAACNTAQNSALYKACQSGNVDLVKFLIVTFDKAVGDKKDQRFIDFINVTSIDGFNVLHNLCLLLKKETDQRKKQPLVETIKILIDCGVDTQLKNNKGKTARQFLPAEFKDLIEATEQELGEEKNQKEHQGDGNSSRGERRHRQHHNRENREHREHRRHDRENREHREYRDHERDERKHREHRHQERDERKHREPRHQERDERKHREYRPHERDERKHREHRPHERDERKHREHRPHERDERKHREHNHIPNSNLFETRGRKSDQMSNDKIGKRPRSDADQEESVSKRIKR